MRRLLLSLLLVGLGVLPACSQPDATARATAEAFLGLLVAERFDEAYAQFESRMAQAMPAATVAQTWAGILRQIGPVQTVTGARVEDTMGLRAVTLVTQFERALVDVRVVLDADGRVTGLFFQPAAVHPTAGPPPYAKPDQFRELDITLRPDHLPLPGTLTLPHGNGPFPLVILVHGSGPTDRDATVGPNKPFRDLAWGLGSRGIAVLRYEKRSRVHPDAFANRPFTVNDEVLIDVFAALAWARAHSAINPQEIHVLGHSLGAMLLPRIGARDAEDRHLAGLILMAPPARPLEDIIPDQLRYLADLDGERTGAEQQQLTQTDSLLALTRAFTPADADRVDLFIGAPPAYWLDLRDYDPTAVARQLHHPMLLLQGGRDYQVTSADWTRWVDALTGRVNVAARVYPALNHLMIAGTGPSSPQEYQLPGYVDPEVIADIVTWLGVDSHE